MSRVLFLALGEEEVQADRYISQLMEREGHSCRVLTWLPRLAGSGVESLYRAAGEASNRGDDLARAAGFADAAFVPHYDRDWHFAPANSRRTHGRSVLSIADEVLREWKPDVLVSAVGGETLRVAFDALAKSRDIRRVYYNAIPLNGRFVLLPEMSSPFVPFPGTEGYRPGTEPFTDLSEQPLPPFKNKLQSPRQEPIIRAAEVTIKNRGIYPRGWYSKKVVWTLREAVLRRIPTTSGKPKPNETNVVYPMHDERDFQVAVRERHAIPQVHFLRYLSTTLPVGHRLWIKPHPHHLSSHHNVILREVADLPNVSFLPPRMHFSEAIDLADVILTLASTMGFEALKRGKPVVCYGTPFYSGYGLTTDVKDPRDIANAILDAQPADPAGVERLLARMEEFSWPGQFTPLDLSPDNLQLLQRGILDVIDS
ncbi:hypothetical protein K3M35_24995 [Rhodococcus sp. DMU2021]|uniref:capsular polysaccharide export protein, LipB/KpsS family n=1 Tax=Rhodococcus sp. DMU2021 TaxID=2866997 RepID=UPI001C7D0767|nr:hypothetical protein [Rhodococcus sp. DMU2021]MBX4171848.1 hypothetical protein [Rhodococcus sp. DMU2021]